MRAIEISLTLPPKALHPNARGHSRYKPTAKPRQDACLAMRSEFARLGMYEMWKAATWQATFTFRTNAHRDGDNLASWMKSYLDGAVTDARLLPGDDARYLTMAAPPSVVVDKAAQEGVTLRFEEVEP